ncbi:hypothetical protein LWI29_038583 [Acer saccharum]|uniref:Trichome birefringence-like N-terminal domain-containing protein n=1 Tax=Acer saccharum TaxID=4024 RepID=A0AA39S796_ACESA|nr:hypothetical protein LWI29_038583 [Acer saccharum]
MAEATKHLKGLCTVFRTRSIAFAYGFMLGFVAFTILFAFNRSSYSPWFTSIFITSTLTCTTPTTSSSSSSTTDSLQGMETLMNCDLFDGEWVHDDSYPLYKQGSCSVIDHKFNCSHNGRPDTDYQKMKWKPKGCNLPRLDGVRMLELLRGKRLVFVGDSLNRNMWESMLCILKGSSKDPSNVFEANGKQISKGETSFSFVFKDYNFSVEFFVSPFLVQEWKMPDKDGSEKETLRLDLMGRSSDQYKDADIIIFNTGHWWIPDKTFKGGGEWNSGGSCDRETEPIKNETYLSAYPQKMKVLESVLKAMKNHVTYLNIARMTDYRKEGHPSFYRDYNLTKEERKLKLKYLIQDCNHWCLPGVPDAWNELLYAELLIKENKMLQH